MTVPYWVLDLAEKFWEAAGTREPFPRGLRRPVARALPMVVILLPRLRLHDVRDWLLRHDIGLQHAVDSRPLRACLLARDGWGYVFLDGSDPEDEQRLSLAHELSHFLRHYWQPRLLVASRVGNAAIDVLDGLRAPTNEEKILAVLAGVSLGFHVHLMERDQHGRVTSDVVALAERDADHLAYELLAPESEVFARADARGDARNRGEVAELLQRDFGIPKCHAACYARLLVPTVTEDPFLVNLKKSRRFCRSSGRSRGST